MSSPDRGHLNQFAKVDEAPENQWAYHAVAGIISANSYLASLEGVAAGRIGITGISWGGFASALAVSFDNRFKFAAPVYGCGGFDSLKLVPDTISMKNLKKWVSLWDPNNYLGNAKLPILWINGTADAAFDIFNWNKSTKLSPKQTYRALRINMPHSQNEGMNAPEILPFAKSVVSGAEFPGFTKIKLDDEGERLGAKWNSSVKIKTAELVATRAAECWNDCLFRSYPAKLNREKRNPWSAPCRRLDRRVSESRRRQRMRLLLRSFLQLKNVTEMQGRQDAVPVCPVCFHCHLKSLRRRWSHRSQVRKTRKSNMPMRSAKGANATGRESRSLRDTANSPARLRSASKSANASAVPNSISGKTKTS